MKWKGRERSQNVEDRRGISPAAAVGGGSLGILIIILIGALFGVRPDQLLGLLNQAQQPNVVQPGQPAPGKDDEVREFIEVVLRDTEKVWGQVFSQHVDGRYPAPKLVLFDSDYVDSGCGRAPAAAGPFYCPADQKIYINPIFFVELERRHQAPGEFARAYVIAHEVAHHVQRVLGFDEPVNRARQRGNEVESNRMSVRLELQADYLAGVWAHHAHRFDNILEPGDIDAAINAAQQIGDDVLMKRSSGYVIPERYTHGTAAQRARWFKRGFQTGDFTGCKQLFEMAYEDL
ncbi:MAG TPA: neutral zinc metallopeptidase [Pirellulaceae bacterium]|nr:neutral zinc metallopeptidase [Pirellulaceae bacterium]